MALRNLKKLQMILDFIKLDKSLVFHLFVLFTSWDNMYIRDLQCVVEMSNFMYTLYRTNKTKIPTLSRTTSRRCKASLVGQVHCEGNPNNLLAQSRIGILSHSEVFQCDNDYILYTYKYCNNMHITYKLILNNKLYPYKANILYAIFRNLPKR